MAAPIARRSHNKVLAFCGKIASMARSSFGARHLVTGFLEQPGHRKLAYSSLLGRAPGVLFCPGFQSTMQGNKALALEAFCHEKGHAFTRFDYQGCGESEGDIRDVVFSDWKSDILAIIDNQTMGPQILVGSSMGAWLAVIAAVERRNRIHAVIGVASAPDFSERTTDNLPLNMQKDLQETGETELDSEYGKYVITQRFLNDLPQHTILTGPQVPLTCPVRLLHGMRDRSVPYQLTLKLAEKIASRDMRVLLRKHGDHRLSEPQDIQILLTELEDLMSGQHTPPNPELKSVL